MNIWEGMDRFRVSLKSDCQMMIQTIIRDETSHRKQQMNQHNISQIQFPPRVPINLDQLTQAYELFSSNQYSQHHWISNLMHQLPKDQYINQAQFFDLLLNEYPRNTNHEVKIEDKQTQFDERYKEYQLFNQIPHFAFLISSLQQISEQAVLFTVRNFQGQIIFLSICPSHQKKITILLRFCQKFNSPALHVFVDSIDYLTSPNTQMNEKEFEKVCKNIDLIYLRRQIDKKEQEDRDEKYVRYFIRYNSLFQKYYQDQQLTKHKNSILATIQKLLSYFFELVREQLNLFSQGYYKGMSLLKSILRINYNRKLQKNLEKSQENLNFIDFINSQIFIYQQLLKNCPISTQLMHFPRNLTPSQKCFFCEIHRNITKITIFQCQGCHQQNNISIPLCAECFLPYHAWRDSIHESDFLDFYCKRNLKNNQIIEQQNSLNNRSLESGRQHDHVFMADENSQRPKLQEEHQNSFQKWSGLSQSQIEKMKLLQQSSQKLSNLFKELKNYQKIYRPLYENPRNQKQFEQELRNQGNFMKVVDIQVRKQIEMFQGEVIISIYDQKQEEERQKNIDIFNKKIKFQFEEEAGIYPSQNYMMQAEYYEENSYQSQLS